MNQSTTSKRRLVAIDLETTMRCKRDGFSSSTPWDTSNEIVLVGAWDGTADHKGEMNIVINESPAYVHGYFCHWSKVIICGHNIKFDIHYIDQKMHTRAFYDWIMENPIWDTSIAHYLLTGMKDKFPTLEEVAKHWLPEFETTKGDLIDRLIAEGKDTTDADPEELREYLRTDVFLTWNVAETQMHAAREKGMLRLILTHGTALKAIQQMEREGLRFNLAGCIDEIKTAQTNLDTHIAHICKLVSSAISAEDKEVSEEDFAKAHDAWLGSNQFWSKFFFGGTYTWKSEVENGTWKSGAKKGLTRYKQVEQEIVMPRRLTPSHIGTTKGKSGEFSVDEKVLNVISKQIVPLTCAHAAKLLLKIRSLEKLINTYLMSMPKKLWTDDTIHPNINQTATDTGRLSSSNPNMQNQDDVIKGLIIPRDTHGYFIEADYKQLEVIALAYLSEEPQLIVDINNGVDIHDVVALEVFGAGYSKEQRRVVKGVNFGTIYGGGVSTISRQSGLDEGTVTMIRNAFFDRYKGIKPYIQHRMNEVRHSVDKDHGTLTTPTGRWYNIPVTMKPSSRGMEIEPAYTKVCNYPIQGLATGDIVPMMLAHMFHWIRDNNIPVRMVNTVHDSILFETHQPLSVYEVTNIAQQIKAELQSAPEVFERIFKERFFLPLKCEVGYSSTSWNGPWTFVGKE